MKYNINPFLISLIKKNFLFFLVFLIFIVINIFLININQSRIVELKNKNTALEKDLDIYQKKLLIIQNLSSNEEKLDKFVKLLNNLIPDQENYFSIIYALENLSVKTGFNIVSYTLNVNLSNPEKIKITVSGLGSTQDFLKFLNEYNFAGGRLITSDSIELNNDSNELYKINLTFYNKKVVLTENFETNQLKEDVFKILNDIEKKVSLNIDFEDEKLLDYPKKQNNNLF